MTTGSRRGPAIDLALDRRSGYKNRRPIVSTGRIFDFAEQGSSMTPNRALTLLIVVSTLIRLVVAALMGLGNDEAYHFLYALHPAPSYYDHPPMVAWVE